MDESQAVNKGSMKRSSGLPLIAPDLSEIFEFKKPRCGLWLQRGFCACAGHDTILTGESPVTVISAYWNFVDTSEEHSDGRRWQ